MGLWTLVKRTFLGDDREEKAEAERELAVLQSATASVPKTGEPPPGPSTLDPCKPDPLARKQESEDRLRKFTEIKSKLTEAQEVLDSLRNGKNNGKPQPRPSVL